MPRVTQRDLTRDIYLFIYFFKKLKKLRKNQKKLKKSKKPYINMWHVVNNISQLRLEGT